MTGQASRLSLAWQSKSYLLSRQISMFYFYSKIELTRLYRLNVVGFGLHRHKNSRAYSNDHLFHTLRY